MNQKRFLSSIMKTKMKKTKFLVIALSLFIISWFMLRVCSETGITRDRFAYLDKRQKLINSERQSRFDAKAKISPLEAVANDQLLKFKQGEKIRLGQIFPPAQNFLTSKKYIDNSPLLDIFKKMPKGAILHAHLTTTGDYRWLISFGTYLPNCYIYTGKNEPPLMNGAIRFFKNSPGSGWKLINQLREAAQNKEQFDDNLFRSITLGEEDLNQNGGQAHILEEFRKCTVRVEGLVNYLPVYLEYCRKLYTDLISEGIQYAEFRSSLSGVYDLEGNDINPGKIIELQQKILSGIKKENPEFNMKIIYSSMRFYSRKSIYEYLKKAVELKKRYPEFIAGFDLTGEEDKRSILYFINEILSLEKETKNNPKNFTFFLHAGESNLTDNENLYDAILIHSKRIGHAYALSHHPLLSRIIKEKQIALEICPISNQVLGYADNLQNHPAIGYLNYGLPITLNPDNPGIMKYHLAYEYYETFLAWGLELKSFKQLAINSINFSAMTVREKRAAMKIWQKQWQDFISTLAKNKFSQHPITNR